MSACLEAIAQIRKQETEQKKERYHDDAKLNKRPAQIGPVFCFAPVSAILVSCTVSTHARIAQPRRPDKSGVGGPTEASALVC